MNEQQFALLMEKLGEIHQCLEMMDSRLYALEECIYKNKPNDKNSYLLVLLQK